MLIKGIIFDLDNTIYDYNNAHKKALEILFKYLKKTYNLNKEINYKKFNDIITNNLGKCTASSHNKILTFKLICEDLDILPNKLLEINEIYHNAFLKNMILYDNIIEFLELCKKNSIKICILTDYILEFTYKKLENLNIFNYIDSVITSEEIGYDKPNKLMFYAALDKLKLKNHEVIMIGDNYEKDIIGSNSINIFALWFAKNNKINNKYIEFNNYNYIINLFNNLFIELEKLINICKFCGNRFDLVQAGGGNISFKYNNFMIIKSSGYNLSKVNKYNGFSILNNNNLLHDINKNIYNNLDNYLLITNNKASIESYMHSFLQKYVIHLHPLAVNIILCRKDAKEIINNLFKESLFINYILPGVELSKEIYKNYKNEKIIFLKNHGIIITCNELEECYSLIDSINDKCEKFLNINLDKYKNIEISNHLYPDSVVYNKNNYEIYKNSSIILKNNDISNLDFLSENDKKNIINYEKDRINFIYLT
jgi:HAD superfamily hydrolase (TIGR01549 family)